MLLTYAEALEAAIAAEMRRDQRVFHMGTIAPAPLVAEFGEERVRRTPISESVMSGMAIGAAASGWRPIVNLRATTFTFVAFDQLVNQAAKIRYMSGGQASFPIVYRTFYIGGQRSAAQHSQSAYAMLAHVPGLKITAPSNPADAYGLLRGAIRDDNPVVHFEANRLDAMSAPVPEDYIVELGSASTCRRGDDIGRARVHLVQLSVKDNAASSWPKATSSLRSLIARALALYACRMRPGLNEPALPAANPIAADSPNASTLAPR